MDKKSETVAVRITQEMKTQLENMATDQERSISNVIYIILKKYLDNIAHEDA